MVWTMEFCHQREYSPGSETWVFNVVEALISACTVAEIGGSKDVKKRGKQRNQDDLEDEEYDDRESLAKWL